MKIKLIIEDNRTLNLKKNHPKDNSSGEKTRADFQQRGTELYNKENPRPNTDYSQYFDRSKKQEINKKNPNDLDSQMEINMLNKISGLLGTNHKDPNSTKEQLKHLFRNVVQTKPEYKVKRDKEDGDRSRNLQDVLFDVVSGMAPLGGDKIFYHLIKNPPEPFVRSQLLTKVITNIIKAIGGSTKDGTKPGERVPTKSYGDMSTGDMDVGSDATRDLK